MKKLLCLGILPAIVLSAMSAGAATRRVPQDYPTIQAGVNAAQTGDVVLVAAGTYGDLHHRAPGDTTKCIVVMKSGITLQGSGPASTIIDAGVYPDSAGRGIYCRHVTNATIRDLTVKRSSGQVFCSGILVRDTSSVSIINCTLTSCLDGGLIMINNCGGTINSVTFSNNVSKQGGGLAMEGCNPTILNCTFTGNQAPEAGGLLVRANSSPVITGCLISNNVLNTASGSGAGIEVTHSTPTITTTQILNNTGTGRGGGIAMFDGSVVTITQCVIQGNTVAGDYTPGGGVYVDGSSMDMENCTITRNTANGLSAEGGGMYLIFPNDVLVKQCTFATNAVPDVPSASAGITCYFASPTIEESIIAFNGPGKAMDCLDAGDNPVVSCTDIFSNTGGNSICGTNGGHNFSLDPLFCDMAHDNYRIALTSPCYPGHHPDGPRACNGDLIGGQYPGCVPAGVDDGSAIPTATRLIGNDPNPFHPTTTIRYELARASRVDLRIFDVAGREVATLASGMRPAGHQQAVWDGRTSAGSIAPSGVYFYRLKIDGMNETRRMVLTR